MDDGLGLWDFTCVGTARKLSPQPRTRGQSLLTHPEVLGVHMQLVAVQLAQLGVGGLDVVQVLHGLPEGGQHLLAVGPHLGVAHNGGGADAVGLGLPGQGLAAAFLHVDLAPQAGDELLLFGCPVHHDPPLAQMGSAALSTIELHRGRIWPLVH
uniref:Uncharacterized protein n=1 Tax=Chelydra serpentina TaxID=8475 RepID=A0A8C3T693_CHESE